MALRSAAAACGAGLLVACGRSTVAPTRSSEITTVTLAADVGALQVYGTPQVRAQLYTQVLRGFEQQHPGIRVQLAAWLPTGANQAAIVAGTAADVFPDFNSYYSYAQTGLLLPLDNYLRRDNIALSIWSPSITAFLALPTGTFALSRGIDAHAWAVNLAALDALGLAYPPQTWTHGHFADLAHSLTVTKGGKTRFGVSFDSPLQGVAILQEFLHGFGGSMVGPNLQTQTLGSPAALAAGRWWFEQFYRLDSAVIGGGPFGGTFAAMQEPDMNHVLNLYQTGWHNGKWTFYPPPVYPHGRSTTIDALFWGISGTSRHPDAAWQLLKWLTTETPWQRFLMKTFLFPPALVSLLTEWEATAVGTVPALARANLQAFSEVGRSPWALMTEVGFRYDSTRAVAADDAIWAMIESGKVDVAEGFAAADREVNALVSAAATEQPTSLAGQVKAHQALQRDMRQMFAQGRPGSGS